MSIKLIIHIIENIGKRWLIIIISLSIILSNATVLLSQEVEEENLNVFWKWLRWNDPGSLQINHMISQADFYYDLRDEEIAKLETINDWRNRQEKVKSTILDVIGPLPEKTPLNPRITGILQKDGFRVEKIIYESMPGLYVTGCLFIPEGLDRKAPAILNVIGHNQEAFRAELYQILYLNLVKKGFIVLAIDPIGQGEMIQYYDPDIGFSSIGYTVVEHFYLGNQCFLSGISPGRYFAWDGIRGIDYLLTRNEVDPDRIGVTGFSGGGTVTSYIAALDDRVKVSVPCSWSTASRRQTETKGTQDAETIFIHGLAKGITFEDLIEVRAPKPTLMTFTSRDEYLSIQGAREAYSEIKRAYKAFDKEANLEFVEDDFKHWMTPKIRSAIYAFFMKHMDIPGDPAEIKVDLLTMEELKVTPTGQISTYLDAENVFSMNKKETEDLLDNLEQSRIDVKKHLDKVKLKAKELTGYIAPEDDSGKPFFNGGYQREGYTIGKYAIKGEGNYIIPLLLFVPDDQQEKYPALIYLHPKGKISEAKPGGEIESLVKKGYIVAAADVLGVGEIENTASRPAAEDYTAILIGRSTVGIQAGDIVRVVKYLQHHNKVDAQKIGAIGIREMCIPLMHAAAFEPSINSVIFADTPISYRSIAMNKYYKIGLIERENGGIIHPYEVDFYWGVAGALTAYDLPDLIGSLAPRKVILAGLRDELLEPASEELIDRDISFPKSSYSLHNMPGHLKILSSYDTPGSLVDWCFE